MKWKVICGSHDESHSFNYGPFDFGKELEKRRKNDLEYIGQDKGIVYFDKCKIDYCAHDLAYFLRRLLKRATTNWNPALTIDIINTYGKVNNLSDSDLKYILAYLAFPQKFWKISRDYYKNINKCNKNSFISLFTKGLDRSADQLEYINTMIEIFQTYYNVKF